MIIFLVPVRYINTLAGYLGAAFFALAILISVVLMLVSKHFVRLNTAAQNTVCVRGEENQAGVSVRNDSPVIIPRVTADVFISDLFGVSDSEQKVEFTLDAGKNSDFGLKSSMAHVGVFNVGVKNIRLYDMFGLFNSRIGKIYKSRITVLPRLYEPEELVWIEEASSEESDNGVAAVSGMDYVGIREYTLGDSMKQIHWKLSAKSREYLTKLTESNRSTSYRVLLDFSAPDYENEELMELNDTLVEFALSVTEQISRQDVEWSLIYYNSMGELTRRTEFPENLEELVNDFLFVFRSGGRRALNGDQLIRDEQEYARRSSNVLFFTCNVTDDLIQELVQVKAQRRRPSLYIVIPDRLNSREREALMKPLGILADNGIPYSITTTAISRLPEKK